MSRFPVFSSRPRAVAAECTQCTERWYEKDPDKKAARHADQAGHEVTITWESSSRPLHPEESDRLLIARSLAQQSGGAASECPECGEMIGAWSRRSRFCASHTAFREQRRDTWETRQNRRASPKMRQQGRAPAYESVEELLASRRRRR